MEEVVFMCVIFLFIILIYNHFFKMKEGLENCNLTGFRKKPPAEVKQMSSSDRSKYNCQLKVLNKKIYSKEEKKKRKVAVTKLVGYICPSDISYVKKYCDQQKGGDDEDEVDVDVEEKGGKKATRNEREGPDPKLHKSQGTLVDKQEKEADKKKD